MLLLYSYTAVCFYCRLSTHQLGEIISLLHQYSPLCLICTDNDTETEAGTTPTRTTSTDSFTSGVSGHANPSSSPRVDNIEVCTDYMTNEGYHHTMQYLKKIEPHMSVDGVLHPKRKSAGSVTNTPFASSTTTTPTTVGHNSSKSSDPVASLKQEVDNTIIAPTVSTTRESTNETINDEQPIKKIKLET